MPAKTKESERRFVPVRFKGDDAHPERKLVFGVVAEDWPYRFVDGRDVVPGDEGLMLVEGGAHPFGEKANPDLVFVKVGDGPAALFEEGEEPETVDYWCPVDPYFVEVIR